jgi:Reverse transcriptase (RNA-dependent DNA polymerase)
VFRARLVACGYSRIPGIDFQEFYAPVINDVVFRIILILQTMFKYEALILDIETAFLNGELDEDIYMLAPKGANLQNDECVMLDKALYGLVQAARQFYLKFARILTKMRFVANYADLCLFFRENEAGKVIIIINVDDCYIIGDKKTIRNEIVDLQNSELKYKISSSASDYLSCDIRIDKDKGAAWVAQTALLKKVEKKFGKIEKKMGNYKYKTPRTLG